MKFKIVLLMLSLLTVNMMVAQPQDDKEKQGCAPDPAGHAPYVLSVYEDFDELPIVVYREEKRMPNKIKRVWKAKFVNKDGELIEVVLSGDKFDSRLWYGKDGNGSLIVMGYSYETGKWSFSIETPDGKIDIHKNLDFIQSLTEPHAKHYWDGFGKSREKERNRDR